MSARPNTGGAFVAALLAWFATAGRAELPWRTDRAPYRVTVSEFMLQQTQVSRAIAAFESFVAAWPDFASLAAAPQADVVRAWKGLGYNSRALRLHGLAKDVRDRFAGVLPRTEAELLTLPGVGRYTARAIAAFAFDAPVAAVDTNVRRVVHRTQLGVEWPPLATPAELDALAGALVPSSGGYAFNSAVMDLGAAYCTARAPKCGTCPVSDACAAAPIDVAALTLRAAEHRPRPGPQQRVAFERSTRYLRGRLVDRLRALGPGESISFLDLHGAIASEAAHHDGVAVRAAVAALVAEGLVEEACGAFRLAGSAVP